MWHATKLGILGLGLNFCSSQIMFVIQTYPNDASMGLVGFAYIGHKQQAIVGNYTRHEWYGYVSFFFGWGGVTKSCSLFVPIWDPMGMTVAKTRQSACDKAMVLPLSTCCCSAAGTWRNGSGTSFTTTARASAKSSKVASDNGFPDPSWKTQGSLSIRLSFAKAIRGIWGWLLQRSNAHAQQAFTLGAFPSASNLTQLSPVRISDIPFVSNNQRLSS